ncbi:hypothetical protein ESCO_005910 [Escovopsis weberi]|uniref:Uncharacterized protein n=1 Tax=Escovopsis weberi TaxID=150374 RepID=A0A0M9VRY1_ESCWE|nr:hypothetical protein ESCO_005910 [Escovopsis weberi]
MAKRTIYLDSYGQDDDARPSRGHSASNPPAPGGGLIMFFHGMLQDARTLVSSGAAASGPGASAQPRAASEKK